ncbi:MAG: DPP IV N-terminal domain-containing protein, partial [Myxococcales bacterium]|nr:DPP IV N-terminal domain-containing protein [Myxococcales bacterium]
VAQEEMGRLEGLWWAPDGSAIAYQRTDTAAMERFHLATLTDPAVPPQASPYPRPGKANAEVRLFVRALEAPAPVEITWDRAAHPYLARVVWPEDGPLSLVTQNRRQTELTLRAADVATGAVTDLITETDPAWVELDAQMPRWLPKGCQFLWTTERNGAWQLELRNADGSLDHALTSPDAGYAGLAHLDTERGFALFQGGPDPTQQHLYRVHLSGKPPEALTTAPGLHGLAVAKKAALALHTHTPERGPTAWTVRPVTDDGALGEPLGTLPSVAEAPGFEANAQWRQVELAGRQHHALIIRPRNFDPAWRYPVIMHVYGGPTHAMVRRAAEGLERDQYIADHGFIVVRADGRATPGRGRD